MRNPHFFQKCCHFCWLCFDFSKNDNTFEGNEDCRTVFFKQRDFSAFSGPAKLTVLHISLQNIHFFKDEVWVGYSFLPNCYAIQTRKHQVSKLVYVHSCSSLAKSLDKYAPFITHNNFRALSLTFNDFIVMCDNYVPQWWVELDNELR